MASIYKLTVYASIMLYFTLEMLKYKIRKWRSCTHKTSHLNVILALPPCLLVLVITFFNVSELMSHHLLRSPCDPACACRGECGGERERGGAAAHPQARVLRPRPARRGWERAPRSHGRSHQNRRGPFSRWPLTNQRVQQNPVGPIHTLLGVNLCYLT